MKFKSTLCKQVLIKIIFLISSFTLFDLANALPCPPNKAFNFLPSIAQCSGSSITFSVTAPQSDVLYSWNFGDTTFATGPNTSHIYNSIGNGTLAYTVKLVAKDTLALCSDSSTQVIQVKQRPSASIANPQATPFTNCPSGGTTFFDLVINNTSSTTATNNDYKIVWGDGTTNYNASTLPSPTLHRYNQIGYFNLIETVTGSNGCIRSDTFSVFNGANPAVSLGTPGATVGLCTPTTLSFPISGTNTNPPGTIYIISKNDGTPNDTFTHPPPATYTHSFIKTSCGSSGGSIANTFFVKIRAQNPCGFSTTTIEPITTNQLPVAKMTVSPDTVVCVNTVVTFTNTSISGSTVNNSGVCNSTTALNWVITPAVGWIISSGVMGSNPADPFNNATWGTSPLKISFTTPGTYQIKLRVQPTNICGYDTIIKTVCVQPIPTPAFTPSATSVCGPAVVNFTDNSTNLPVCLPLTYLWTITKTSFTCPADSVSNFVYTSGTTSASPNPIVRFNNQGTYTVTLSLTNKCGTFTTPAQTITVKLKPQFTISATPSTICRGQSVTPSISNLLDCGDVVTSYSWTFTGGNPASSLIQVPGNVSYAAGGNYTISLAVQNGCGTVNRTTPVTVNVPPVTSAGSDQAVCINSGNVTLVGSPAGGTWSGTNVTAGGVFTPSSQGTFNLIYTATANGCPSSDTMVMTVNPLPVVTLTPSTSICNKDSISLTAGGANTYVWSPGATLSATTGATVTAKPTSLTTYTVTATITASNCTATRSTTITVNPLPVVDAGVDQILCNQPIPVTLTGTPAGGVWSGPNVTSGGVFTPSGTGVFSDVYTYTNGNNCTNKDTIVLTVINPTIPSAGNDTAVCRNSGSVTLVASPAGGTWSGTNVTVGGVFTPSAVGTTNLVYSYGSGTCLKRDTMVMTVNPLPTITLTASTAICIKDSITLTAGGADTYSWSPSATLNTSTGASVIAKPIVLTTYTVTGTITATGCNATRNSTITVNPLPVVDAGVDQTLCNQPIATSLTGTPAGGTWSGANITAGGVFTPSGLGSFPEIYTYTNGNNCTNKDTIVLTVINPTIPSAGNDTAVCRNSGSVTLVASPAGGTWSGTNVTVGGVFTPSAVGTTNLVYSYGSGTCLKRDTMVMTVNPLPTITLTASTAICIKDSITLTAGGADTYSWSPSATLNTSTGASVIAKPIVLTTYTVTGTITATGCNATRNSTITVNPLPVVDAGVDQTLCNQPIATSLTGTPAGGTWSGANITAGGVFTPSGLGSFPEIYTYTNGNNCTNRDTVLITVVNAVIPSAGNDTAVCRNSGNVTIIGTPAGGTWSGTNVTAGGVFTPSTAGSFNLVYSYGSGTCLGRDTMVMTVNPLPTITLTANSSICIGDSIILTAGGANTYSWSPSATLNTSTGASVIAKPTVLTTYTVTATSVFNCSATRATAITVNPLPVVDAGVDQVLCNQPIPVTLTGTPAGGTWSGAHITAGGVFTPSGLGSFPEVYTYTNGNNCRNKDTLTVTVVNAAIPNAGNDTAVCRNSGNVTLIGNPAGGTWSGTNITAGGVFTPSTVGSLNLVYSYGSGTCLRTDTMVMTVNPLPSVTLTASTSICIGDSISLVAGGGDTYVWSPGGTLNITTGTTVVAKPATPTTYTVTATISATNCSATRTTTISIKQLPVTNLPADQSVCEGSSSTAVNIGSSISPTTFTWTASSIAAITNYPANGSTTSIPVFTPSNLDSFPNTIIYTIIPASAGCIGNSSTYIYTVNPLPNLKAITSQEICSGGQTIAVTPTSDIPTATYTWSSASVAGVTGNTLSGNGNIPVETLLNSNNLPRTIVYTITPTAYTCPGNSLSYNVTVNPAPNVNAIANQTICSGQSTTSIVPGSSVGGAIFNWTSVAGPSITGNTLSGVGSIPIQTLVNSSSANDTVVYSVTATANGCTGPAQIFRVIVKPKPIAIITTISDTICSGSQVSISLTSAVAGTTFSWVVSTPGTITGAKPGSGILIDDTLTSTSATSQSVVYTISPIANGCPGNQTFVTITVKRSASILFKPSAAQVVCNSTLTQPVVISSNTSGATIVWTAVTPPLLSGVANGGDTLIPAQTIVNSTNATQQVTYNVSVSFQGCPGQTGSYTIDVKPTAHILNVDTAQTICSGDSTIQFTFSPDVLGSTFSWSTVGNPNITGYLSNGTASILPRKLINSSNQEEALTYTVTPVFSGCPGVSRDFIIKVRAKPVFTLTPDTQSVCNNTNSQAVIASSSVTGTQFSWNTVSNIPGFVNTSGTGDTIPPILFQYPGIFTDTGYVQFQVTASALGCAAASKNAIIKVNPLPTINFAMSQDYGCSPLNVNFVTNPFVYGNPDSLVFVWGDSTPNTIVFKNSIQPFWRTINHAFVNSTAQLVSYVIQLTAYNNCGSTVVYDTVTVLPNRVDAQFSTSVVTGCEPLSVTFNNVSTGALTNSWCFNFDTLNKTCLGPSTVNNSSTLQQTFAAGNYTIALYITDGCSNDTAYVNIKVNPSPVSAYTVGPNVCEKTAVTFTDQSTIPAGQFLASTSWQFGDGGSSLGTSTINHTYSSAGGYNVCHITTLSNGCADTLCNNLQIDAKPVVAFTGYDTCINSQPIQIINNTTGASSYIWDFGDGNNSNQQTPNHIYANPGTYTVTLIGTANLCSDTLSRQFTLKPIPNAAFTVPASYFCGVPATVQTQNASSGALFYDWDFGNGTTSTNTNPNVTYTTTGNYAISLVATNQFGCHDTATQNVIAYAIPVIQSIDIEPHTGCQPLYVKFTANTTNGNIFTWDFGDGSAPVTVNSSVTDHTYQDTGTYSVSLIALSFADCGDSVKLFDTIRVNVTPLADFEYQANTTLKPTDRTIILLNTSQLADSYVWDFGDQNSATDVNPNHTYAESGEISVTLIAFNQFCSDTISKSSTLFSTYLWVPNAFAPDFGGNNDLVKVWKPVGIGLKTLRAQVFNTWGELIWESTKLVNSKPVEYWDGTYHGNLCAQDVYVWQVDAVFLNGERWEGMAYENGGKKTKVGSITLVR